MPLARPRVTSKLAEVIHRMFHKAAVSLLGGFTAVFIAALILRLVNQEIAITNQIVARTAPSLFCLGHSSCWRCDWCLRDSFQRFERRIRW